MFLFCNDIDFASYADDNTSYCIGKTPEEVISQLEKSSKSIFEWLENNGMKANPDKCHLLLSKNENFEANINENRISNTRFEKLLGVTFDNQLNFNHHISKICKTASNKLHALARVSNFIDEDKRRIVFNLYFSSQFNYCPLIWMNHNKSTNKKINNLHERALRLIYCDHSSDFQELLQRDNSVTIHQKNIQALAIMMYKVVNNIAPTIVSELFSYSNVNYNLRSGSHFHQIICKYSMEWTGNHIILRTKNLEYGARGNETKNYLYLLSKEKLSNGSPTTVRVGYVKTTYLISGLFNTPCSCCCFLPFIFYLFFYYCTYAHFFPGFDN